VRAAWARLRARGSDRGASETIEAVVWIPLLVAIILLGVAASQISRASSTVDDAAAAAARAASLSTTAEAAQQAGQDAAAAALGTKCQQLSVDVDASQLNAGTPGAAVRATVSCSMSLSVVVPGLPGHFTQTRTETSPIDLFREGP
jgi:Flp pilus assembly protein TadG